MTPMLVVMVFYAAKHGWTLRAVSEAVGLLMLVAAIFLFMYVDAWRAAQRHVSDSGVQLSVWALSAKFPFVRLIRRDLAWHEFVWARRLNANMYLTTPTKVFDLNLFVFGVDADEVEKLIIDQVRRELISRRSASAQPHRPREIE